MRDKQAFEVYVLEKSKIEKKKIALRRKTILTAGMSLCICLIALLVLPGIWEQTGNSSDRVPEAWPEGGSNHATPVPTIQNVVGGTEDGGDGTTAKPAVTKNATAKPATTEEQKYGVGGMPPSHSSVPPEALPLDQAFAQGQSGYAIPDRIECLNGGTTYSITETPILCDICDWVMEGTFAEVEGIQPEVIDWTITIYYGQDRITCYVAESGLFKMGEGAWLKTDSAYVRALLACFGG